MKKKCLAFLLALVMCLGLLPAPAFAADSDFIIKNGILTKYIGPGGDVVIPNGVTGIGGSAFSGCTGLTSVTIPNTSCTRADAVNYIWQAADKGAASYDGRFTDVPRNSPYATAVAWAVANGVTTGTSATTFTPGKICNRGEIVTFLHRYFGK